MSGLHLPITDSPPSGEYMIAGQRVSPKTAKILGALLVVGIIGAAVAVGTTSGATPTSQRDALSSLQNPSFPAFAPVQAPAPCGCKEVRVFANCEVGKISVPIGGIVLSTNNKGNPWRLMTLDGPELPGSQNVQSVDFSIECTDTGLADRGGVVAVVDLCGTRYGTAQSGPLMTQFADASEVPPFYVYADKNQPTSGNLVFPSQLVRTSSGDVIRKSGSLPDDNVLEGSAWVWDDVPTSSPGRTFVLKITVKPIDTCSPTLSPTASPSPWPTWSPSTSPTRAPTPPTPEPTVSPTKAPTPPTPLPTASPSPWPTWSPTLEPTTSPSESPSKAPTRSPSEAPTRSPSKAPTRSPSAAPTDSPTDSPSEAPTDSPTDSPSEAPTDSPSEAPTDSPSEAPTRSPSKAPTDSPSKAPSKKPTGSPSKAPTDPPSKAPTDSPSKPPSKKPTGSPSKAPSKKPTAGPTKSPSRSPSKSPSKSPTVPDPQPPAPPTNLPTSSPTPCPTTFRWIRDPVSGARVIKYYDCKGQPIP